MPKHSPRPTAGRKPRVDRPEPAAVVVVPPPRHLTKAEREIWRRLAKPACRMGTLIEETIPGFELLCQTLAERARAAALLDSQGLLVDGAINPVAVHFRQLTQRAEALMVKYAIAAPGRPVERPAVAKPPSKWDGILLSAEEIRRKHARGDLGDDELLDTIQRIQ